MHAFSRQRFYALKRCEKLATIALFHRWSVKVRDSGGSIASVAASNDVRALANSFVELLHVQKS